MPERGGLRVEDLHGHYGPAHILFGVSLEVASGHSLALLGRNGAGKSTLLKSIARTQVRTRGGLWFDGIDLSRLTAFQAARQGVQLVPEDRRIYPRFTVRENLLLARMASAPDRPPLPLETILEVFPSLTPLLPRRGDQLSGGEQQLVAIARAMVANPRLLLMDEPSAGLSPVLMDRVAETITRLREAQPLTLVISEQNVPFGVSLCDEVAVIDEGRIVFTGTRAMFEQDRTLQTRYLAV
jgi:ABC-type branched-subunit amino acid transport system ATPase component